MSLKSHEIFQGVMCFLWTKQASVYLTTKCQTKVLTDLFDKVAKRF